jgi:hypothetical protein
MMWLRVTYRSANGQAATVESYDLPIIQNAQRGVCRMEVSYMITQTPPKAKKTQPTERQPLEPTRLYSRKDLSAVTGAHTHTFMRAYLRGHLEGLNVGKLVFHTGAQVFRWLEAGGKTA